MAEKHPNISSYTYCANNPINLVDPDGNDFISYVLKYYGGTKGGLRGYSTKNGTDAMKMFMKTSEGKNFVTQFMGKGDKAFGYTATKDGKYSNYTFKLYQNGETEQGARGGIMGSKAEAWFGARVKDGKLEFFATIDGMSGVNGLTENILHELLLHGDLVNFYVKKFEELGPNKFESWYTEYRKNNENDHIAIRDHDESVRGYKRYNKAKNELLKFFPDLKEVFESQDKFYKKEYNDYKKKPSAN